MEFNGSDGKREKLLKKYYKDKNVGKIKKMRTMKIVDLRPFFKSFEMMVKLRKTRELVL